MKLQNKKILIDTGIVGNASTGDIIYDGGEKINSVISDLYDVFGDRRLLKSNDGQKTMILHGTGYYQKLERPDYISEIEIGSMHDISTIDGPLTIRLPTNAKQGERIRISNSDGSWKNFALSVDAQVGGNIDGKQVQIYRQEKCEIQFICVADTQLNVRFWKALITPLYGDYFVPVNKTVTLGPKQSSTIDLYKMDEYTGLKLMVVGEEIINTNEQTFKQMMEILLLNDKEQVLSTEYGVLFTSPEKLFTVEFSMSTNKQSVVAKVTSTQLDKQIKVKLKSIEQIEI